MDDEITLPPRADARTPMQKLYDNAVRPLGDAHADEGVRAQLEAAFANAPATPDDVDGWFLEHFHKAPVSHDTTLFNQLQAIRAAVRDAAGLDAG